MIYFDGALPHNTVVRNEDEGEDSDSVVLLGPVDLGSLDAVAQVLFDTGDAKAPKFTATYRAEPSRGRTLGEANDATGTVVAQRCKMRRRIEDLGAQNNPTEGIEGIYISHEYDLGGLAPSCQDCYTIHTENVASCEGFTNDAQVEDLFNEDLFDDSPWDDTAFLLSTDENGNSVGSFDISLGYAIGDLGQKAAAIYNSTDGELIACATFEETTTEKEEESEEGDHTSSAPFVSMSATLYVFSCFITTFFSVMTN